MCIVTGIYCCRDPVLVGRLNIIDMPPLQNKIQTSLVKFSFAYLLFWYFLQIYGALKVLWMLIQLINHEEVKVAQKVLIFSCFILYQSALNFACVILLSHTWHCYSFWYRKGHEGQWTAVSHVIVISLFYNN